MKIKERKWLFLPLLLVLSLLVCVFVACDKPNDDSGNMSVVSFEKVGSEGRIDTYKITYSNGTSTTFTVTNGTDGTDGVNGIDGVGISEVKKTSSAGLVDTYTIYFTDGSTATFTVTNGNSVTDDITNDDAFEYYPLDDGTLGIGGGSTKYLSSVEIPSEYRGKTVTRIVADAFSNFSNLQEITIPNTIKYIDERAFSGCNALTAVSIPDSVLQIRDSAFQNCSDLQTVAIGNNVTVLGSGVFTGCKALTAVSIPDSVLQIGDSAFENCSDLQTVAIGNNVTVLGGRVFLGCKALTAVSIPDSVTTIGDNAFAACTNLQTVELGQKLDSTGLYVFNGCSSLKTISVAQGNSKYAGGDGYVYDNTGCLVHYCYGKLAESQTLILADGVTKIGDGIFYEELNYEVTFGEIVLPDSLVEIETGNNALIVALAESEYAPQWHIIADSITSSAFPNIDGMSLDQLLDVLPQGYLMMFAKFCKFYRVI